MTSQVPAPSLRAPRDLITVDVEDYYQVASFADVIPRQMWDRMESRVESSTKRVLDLLDAVSVRATFFVLGWVAERHPGLIREIAARGHELGSHGYDHRRVTGMTPREFRDDIGRTKRILEDLASVRVRGYRAPTFSLHAKVTPWAWAILAEEGYLYDSSTFPIHHDRYGDPRAGRHVHVMESPGSGGGVLEFPLTTLRILGVNLPAAGGGYLRVLPLSFIRAAIRESHRRGFPAVIYFHPWELDPQQPQIHASWLSRLRHYANLGKTEAKLRDLLARGGFGSIEAYLKDRASPDAEFRQLKAPVTTSGVVDSPERVATVERQN